MSGAEVNRLLLCLPDDNPFIRALFPNERWRTATPGDRLRVGRWNPQLLWDMAQAHAQAGQPLPELDLPQDLRRAYAFLAGPDSSDESMALVHMLHLPDLHETLLEADLIDAALICEDLTHQAIADLFQYDPEVIRLEDQLLFNYRDRRSEALYAVQIFLSSRLDSPGAHLKHLAYKTRNSHWVLAAAGILQPAQGVLPPEVLADEIERDLLRLAITGVRKNLLDPSDNPALALVEKYLLPLRQKAKAVEPLHGLQLHPEDLGVLYTELNERLILLRGNAKDGPSSNELRNLHQAGSNH
jgi:hypothetical protein